MGKNEWISVKQKLPKIEERCLVYNTGYDGITKGYVEINEFIGIDQFGNPVFIGDDVYYSEERENVTHWMSLPEPPEVKQKCL